MFYGERVFKNERNDLRLFGHQKRIIHPVFIDTPYKRKHLKKQRPKAFAARLIGLMCGLVALGILVALSQRAQALTAPSNSHYASAANTSLKTTEIPEEVTSGELLFKENGQAVSALLVKTEVSAKLSGLIAQVTYTQHFKNTSDQWQEAIYAFPLSEEAAINALKIQVGERTIIGEIKEKVTAQKIYQQAKKAGKQAALTEQQRPNFFTQRVANIAPHTDIQVTLTYLQPIAYDHGSFEWRLPTTFTPRYIPGQPGSTQNTAVLDNAEVAEETQAFTFAQYGWGSPTAQVPDAPAITPPMIERFDFGADLGHPLTLTIELDAGLPLQHIDALYHSVNIQKKSAHGRYRITLDRATAMNRDFTLQWTPIKSQQPQAALFHEEVAGEHFALAMVLPPQSNSAHALPRDVIFIIDTSGSMQGTSIVQAKQSLSLALHQLKPDDRFNIVEFNSNIRTLFSDFTVANQPSVQHAERWVNNLTANGGTEILPALQAAFSHADDQERLQQIIFITDGSIGNEAPLLNAIHNNLGKARLFTVAIGSAPNHYFMRKAAEFGRGSFVAISDTHEVTQKMGVLFNKLENTLSQNIHIEWHDHAEQYPSKTPDLYAGEPLVVAAKLQAQPTTLIIDGINQQGPWQRTLQRPTNDASVKHSGVSTLWARKKIAFIEDERIRGNLSESDAKQSVTDLGLTHNLITRFTSFVAVAKEVARPQHEKLNTQAVSNLVAQDQVAQGQKMSYPQTATTAGMTFWLGLFAFVGFLFIRAMRDSEF